MGGAADEMAWKCTQVPPETNQMMLCCNKCNADYKGDLARGSPGVLQALNCSLPLQKEAGFPVSHLSWLFYSWAGMGTRLEELVLTLFSWKFLSSSEQEIPRFHDNRKKSKWLCIKVKRIQFRMWIELQVTKHNHKPKELAVCKLVGFSIHRKKKEKKKWGKEELWHFIAHLHKEIIEMVLVKSSLSSWAGWRSFSSTFLFPSNRKLLSWWIVKNFESWLLVLSLCQRLRTGHRWASSLSLEP